MRACSRAANDGSLSPAALALSDEFETRWRPVPCDVQLCELANPAKVGQPGMDRSLLRSLGLSDDRVAMHRKPYELTQLLYGCPKLGMLTPTPPVVSIGAGHEIVLYWLANRVNRVVATDLYERSTGPSCADAKAIRRADKARRTSRRSRIVATVWRS